MAWRHQSAKRGENNEAYSIGNQWLNRKKNVAA